MQEYRPDRHTNYFRDVATAVLYVSGLTRVQYAHTYLHAAANYRSIP